MFTGLIREVGTAEDIRRGEAGARLRVGAELAPELGAGDSVAVAGVCLTVAERGDDAFEADAINQTLSLTTLGDLRPRDPVNLEPALRAGEPLGGHLVQGHVDGVATVTEVREDGASRRVRVELPAELRRYVAPRGSIALDGVSLTVAEVHEEVAEVALIPETLARTTLGRLERGSRLNVEVDLVARHLERLVQGFTERRTSDG
jgi:riboflavin synthase alpha subunit